MSVRAQYVKLRGARATRGSRLLRSPIACQTRSHTCFAFFIAFFPTEFRAKERLRFRPMMTSRSMFSCSRGVQEPLGERSFPGL